MASLISFKRFLVGACWLITLALLALFLIFHFPGLYAFYLHQTQINQTLNLSTTKALQIYQQLLNYLNNPFSQSLNLALPSSKSGLQHFKDVHQLITKANFLLVIGLIISIITAWRSFRHQTLWLLLRPLMLGLGAELGLLVLLGTFFEKTFITFHELLFTNQAWLFNASTDPIIKLLPLSFFQLAGTCWLVLTLLGTLLLIIIINRQTNKKSQ